MSDTADTPEDKNRLISLPEAAELYGFNAAYLSQLANKGRLKAKKIGNSWVTTPNDVEEYIRSRQKRGAYRDDIQVD
jgi:predicted DNA-binding transcriptional regulator AlpA